VDHSDRQRADAAELPPLATMPVAGGVRLASASGATSVSAGDKARLTLLWVGNPTAVPAQAQIVFAGQATQHTIGSDAYPSTAWRTGDVVRETVEVRVPPQLAAGTYPLAVAGSQVARVQVTPTTRLFSAAPMSHPSSVRFGDVAELLGYDQTVDATGIHLKLAWRALSETDTSFTAFVHALAPDGSVAGQVDRPLGTDLWDQGEVNIATYDLAASNQATLEVGVYEPVSGKRLPASSGGDSIVLPVS
jgi:hypothetical protein